MVGTDSELRHVRNFELSEEQLRPEAWAEESRGTFQRPAFFVLSGLF